MYREPLLRLIIARQEYWIKATGDDGVRQMIIAFGSEGATTKAQPGNGHEAQAGEEASAAANGGTHTRVSAGITSGIGCAVITIYRHDGVWRRC